MTSTKKMVEYILDNYPQTRNCDNKLRDWICWKYNLLEEKAKDVWFILSIVKTRQKFQRDGKYLADPEVVAHRRRLAAIVKSEQLQTKKQIQENVYQNVFAN